MSRHSHFMTDAVIIATVILFLYAVLAYHYPIIYGGDTIIRIVNAPRILLSYQLPLFQALIHVTHRLSLGAWGIWLLMGALSASAALGIYALTRQLSGERQPAIMAALFYATHPFVLYYGRVPYQESLLLTTTSWGFFLLFRSPAVRNWAPAAVLLGAASLTRYEGWIAAMLAPIYVILKRSREVRVSGVSSRVLLIAGFTAVPVIWVLWHGGLSPPGTYVLEIEPTFQRLYRPYFVLRSALWWSGPVLTFLVLVGILGLRTNRHRAEHLALACYLGVYLSATVFSAHGIRPDPVRLVTERIAFVPIGILMIYAGMGADRSVSQVKKFLPSSVVSGKAMPVLMLAVVAAYGLYQGIGRIASANADPVLRTDFEVGRFLAEKKVKALVLARPFSEADLEYYLRQAEKAGGPDARKEALRVLEETETTPFDHQRILVHSWLDRESVVAAEKLESMDASQVREFVRKRGIQFVVVMSDFVPVKPHEERILEEFVDGRAPALQFENGEKKAFLFSVRP